ncbi:hypothetical protein [Lysobacter sp. 1R34A]|uniref:hypothetical protein n=1 Tax=Lysobacter sp. 1R34A TaxID=3445786 RepID=UPI003EE8EAC6
MGDSSSGSKWLPDFDAMAAQVRKLSDDFGHHYRRHVDHSQVEIPDFRRERAPIHLMPSLSGFDGHPQPWRGKLPWFVGCRDHRRRRSAGR